jgi:hypothetical protein
MDVVVVVVVTGADCVTTSGTPAITNDPVRADVVAATS